MSIEDRSRQYGKVFEHWQIREFLGSGSGGKTAVFRLARADSARGSAALKVISLISERGRFEELSDFHRREYVSAREERSRSAEQEVWLMDDLRGNTNIVDYQDHTFVDWEDETGFGRDLLIRMELLQDLRSVLREGTNFSGEEVVKVGLDICNALILCHSKNILHRDVKPENIFRNRDGNYKLGDFGVSRVLDACPGAAASTGIGTFEYWPAEQMRGGYDKRVDIYSLGIVLYELSNQNRLPFAASTYAAGKEVYRRLSGEELPAPSEASPELAAVILKACAFRPEDRYQTAEELRDALERLGKGEEAPKKPRVVWEEPLEEPKLARKQGILRFVAAGLALIAVTAGVFRLSDGKKAEEPAAPTETFPTKTVYLLTSCTTRDPDSSEPGQTLSYEYDDFGLLRRTVGESGPGTYYLYDDGSLMSRIDALNNENAPQSQRDALAGELRDMLGIASEPGVEYRVTTYDANGYPARVTGLTEELNEQWEYTLVYNSRGQLLSRENSYSSYDYIEYHETYLYDMDGTLIQSEWASSDPNVKRAVTVYTYDDRGNLTEQTTTEYNADSTTLTWSVRRTYNSDGLPTQELRYSHQGEVDSIYDLFYDDAGNLIRQEYTDTVDHHRLVWEYTYQQREVPENALEALKTIRAEGSGLPLINAGAASTATAPQVNEAIGTAETAEPTQEEPDYDPWVSYASMEEAEEILGFGLELPEMVNDFDLRIINVAQNPSNLWVVFRKDAFERDPNREDKTIAVSKMISIQKYPDFGKLIYDPEGYDTQLVTIGGSEVVLLSDNREVAEAYWIADGFGYCVIFENCGLSADTVIPVIAAIH